MLAVDDLRIRHLEDIGGIITRLSQNSFTARGWSVTLVSIVFAIIGTQDAMGGPVIAVALAPAFIFWGLDAYYLRQERLFRRLYATIARQLIDPRAPEVALFTMSVAPYAGEVAGYVRTLFSLHVVAIPAMLTLLIAGYSLIGR